jgi:putative FmdB family regulatory protein
MPLYEYQCELCEHRFERIQKFSDPPVETCPSCGGSVKKLLSSPAIQFKGSGWYITDYARKSSKTEAKTGTDGKDAAASSASKESGDSSSGESAKKQSKDSTPGTSANKD